MITYMHLVNLPKMRNLDESIMLIFMFKKKKWADYVWRKVDILPP